MPRAGKLTLAAPLLPGEQPGRLPGRMHCRRALRLAVAQGECQERSHLGVTPKNVMRSVSPAPSASTTPADTDSCWPTVAVAGMWAVPITGACMHHATTAGAGPPCRRQSGREICSRGLMHAHASTPAAPSLHCHGLAREAHCAGPGDRGQGTHLCHLVGSCQHAGSCGAAGHCCRDPHLLHMHCQRGSIWVTQHQPWLAAV
jgi:hypothetical protein